MIADYEDCTAFGAKERKQTEEAFEESINHFKMSPERLNQRDDPW